MADSDRVFGFDEAGVRQVVDGTRWVQQQTKNPRLPAENRPAGEYPGLHPFFLLEPIYRTVAARARPAYRGDDGRFVADEDQDPIFVLGQDADGGALCCWSGYQFAGSVIMAMNLGDNFIAVGAGIFNVSWTCEAQIAGQAAAEITLYPKWVRGFDSTISVLNQAPANSEPTALGATLNAYWDEIDQLWKLNFECCLQSSENG